MPQELLQGVLSNDLGRVEVGRAQYTLLTNESGGIVDDLIAYKLEPGCYLLVVNASNRDADYTWLKDREIRGSEVRDVSDEYAMLAVQGPRAIERLGLDEAPVVHVRDGGDRRRRMPGRAYRLHRRARGRADLRRRRRAALWDAVVARGATPCGLGARDTLRLEMCYPLHGNDITAETDAISAGLGWACALDKEFTGAEELRRIKEEGPSRRLVPFVMEDKAVPRQGMAVEGGGEVTSGTHSPMLDRGIGMAYMPAGQFPARHRARGRRARPTAPRPNRGEADLQEGARGRGSRRELPARS